MTTAGRIVATDKLGVGTIEINDFGLHTFDRVDESMQIVRFEAAASNVHPDSGRYGSALALHLDESLEQVGWKIVDDVPAHVLQGIEDSRFARSGHTRDEQQTRPSSLTRPSGVHLNLRPILSRASATFDGAEAVIASTLTSGTLIPNSGRSRLSSGRR